MNDQRRAPSNRSAHAHASMGVGQSRSQQLVFRGEKPWHAQSAGSKLSGHASLLKRTCKQGSPECAPCGLLELLQQGGDDAARAQDGDDGQVHRAPANTMEEFPICQYWGRLVWRGGGGRSPHHTVPMTPPGRMQHQACSWVAAGWRCMQIRPKHLAITAPTNLPAHQADPQALHAASQAVIAPQHTYQMG